MQEGVEELQLGLAVDQARAEFAEDGVVEAGIGQFQGEGVLPVDSPADGIGGLAIEVLNPAGRVVCSVSDAGIGLLVAEVKLQSCVVMIVGVGLSEVRDR